MRTIKSLIRAIIFISRLASRPRQKRSRIYTTTMMNAPHRSKWTSSSSLHLFRPLNALNRCWIVLIKQNMPSLSSIVNNFILILRIKRRRHRQWKRPESPYQTRVRTCSKCGLRQGVRILLRWCLFIAASIGGVEGVGMPRMNMLNVLLGVIWRVRREGRAVWEYRYFGMGLWRVKYFYRPSLLRRMR